MGTCATCNGPLRGLVETCEHGLSIHTGCALEWDDPCRDHRTQLEGETFSYDERDLGGEA